MQLFFICYFQGNGFIWNYVMAVSCAWQYMQFGAERRSPTHLTRLQTKSLYLSICKRCAEAEDVLWQSCRRGWEGFITSGSEGVGWLIPRAACLVNPHPRRQKLPHHAHTEGRRVSVRQRNGNLKSQGPAGGRDFPEARGDPAEPLQHPAGWRGRTHHIRGEAGAESGSPICPCVTTSTTSKGDRWQ